MPLPGHTNAAYRTARIKIPLGQREGRGLVDVLNEFFAYNPMMTLRSVHADVRFNNRYGQSNALFTFFYSTPTGTRYFAEEFTGNKQTTASQRAQAFLDNNPSFVVVKLLDVSSLSKSLEYRQRLVVFYLDQSNLYEADWGMVKSVLPESVGASPGGSDVAQNSGAVMGDPIDPNRPPVWVWNFGSADWPAGAPFLAFKTEDRLGEFASIGPCCYSDRGNQGPFDLLDRSGIPPAFGDGYTTFLTTTFTATTTHPILRNIRETSNKPALLLTSTTPPPSRAWQFGKNVGSSYLQDFELVLPASSSAYSVATVQGQRALVFSGSASPLDIELLIKKGAVYGGFDVTLSMLQTGEFSLVFNYTDENNYWFYNHVSPSFAPSLTGLWRVQDGVTSQVFQGGGALDGSSTYTVLRYVLEGEKLQIWKDGVLVQSSTVSEVDFRGRIGLRAFAGAWTMNDMKIQRPESADCCRRTTYVCAARRSAEGQSVPVWRVAEVECVSNSECVAGNVCDGNNKYTFEEKNVCFCGKATDTTDLPTPPDSCLPECGSPCYEITFFSVDTDFADCSVDTSEVSNALSAASGFKYRGAPEEIVDRVLRGVSVPTSCSIPSLGCSFDFSYRYPDGAFTKPTRIRKIFDGTDTVLIAVGFSDVAKGIGDGSCLPSVQQYRSMVITVFLKESGACDE